MKILTWNVNGIRTIKQLGVLCKSSINADVICFQETKISRCQLDNDIAKLDGFYSFFSFCKAKQGYSGVVTYVKKAFCPFKVEFGPDVDSECEGRILITFHKTSSSRSIAVINAYVPCGYDSEDPARYQVKLKFLDGLHTLSKGLEAKNCDVIIVGDLNVKAMIIDSAEAFENRHSLEFVSAWHGASDKIIFRKMIEETFIDCFRYIHPSRTESFTCWNSGLNARVNNYGTRIDYILVSKRFQDNTIRSCEILSDVMGSDHCPVLADLQLDHVIESEKIPPECSIYFPELKGTQKRISSMFKRKLDNESTSGTIDSINQSLDNSKKPKTVSKKSSTTQAKLSFASKTHVFKGNDSNIASNETTVDAIIDATPPSFKQSSNKINGTSGVSAKSLLTGLPKPPLCSGHKLRSTLKTVTKDGKTKGKRFYCCSLPIGPSSSPKSQCNFFKWLD